MGLTDTQKEIEHAIRNGCMVGRPFMTVNDITEDISVSKRTVQNNADVVVEHCDDIVEESVGKANVYYIQYGRMADIETDATVAVARLSHLKTRAEYVELYSAPEESPFDLLTRWYDSTAEELEDYFPDPDEIGVAADLYGSDPKAIKYYEWESTEGGESGE